VPTAQFLEVQFGLGVILLLGHPRVGEDLHGSEPFVGAGDHAFDQVDRVFGDTGPLVSVKIVLALVHSRENLEVGIAVERRVPTEDNVEDDPGRPDVT